MLSLYPSFKEHFLDDAVYISGALPDLILATGPTLSDWMDGWIDGLSELIH